MAKDPKGALLGIKSAAIQKAQGMDVDTIKKKAAAAGDILLDKAVDIKDAAVATKDDIESKLTELDKKLEQAITDYNAAYTLMNDKGVQLFVERSRAVDTISFIEQLVNSIANRPKEFDSDFEKIETQRRGFIDSCEFADRELKAARLAAGSSGAGLAAGASVAFMAPRAAMWVATTFGTASTGTAISALSGAAATNAALAWLGGGALTASGGGMAAGNALLAMAGPIGWTIAGATLLSSILLFSSKKTKLNKQKNEEIGAVKVNTETVQELDAKISDILNKTESIRNGLNNLYAASVYMHGMDYMTFSDEQKNQLGQMINNTKALSALFGKTLE